MSDLDVALTFDDVLIKPRYSAVLPKSVSLRTDVTSSLPLNCPILSSAMDTVTESDMAISMAELGGMGVLHKNMSEDDQADQVRRVKKFESGIVHDPITVSTDTTLAELKAIIAREKISGMPVVSADNALLGIVTSRDIRFETDNQALVQDLMTPKAKLITIKQGATREAVRHKFRQHRVEKLLIVDDQFHLCGLVTVKDILRAKQHPNAIRDEERRLRVAAAVGAGEATYSRIDKLVMAGVDLLVVDTAHGHSAGVIETVRWIKSNHPQIPVMAGNIATGEAAVALADAGADAVKVGMGPGSICTTRVVAGIGAPQISAIMSVRDALGDRPVKIIADGGIRFSGDVCKAIVAGAHAVMIGGLFAGTEEAPGDVVLFGGRAYKTYRGMGSVGAMAQQHGSSDRYFQEADTAADKLVPEGIEGRVPFKGTVASVVMQLTGGLRASMGYTGCATISAMRTETEFMRITNAGMRESHVHDVVITKEAPNYWVDK